MGASPRGAKGSPSSAAAPKITLNDVTRHVAFGGICGAVTGLTIGAVDAYRMVKGGSVARSKAAPVAFHEMGRSGLVVAGFFSIYQVIKCGLLAADVDAPEIRVGGATAASLLPLTLVPALRRLAPYCLTLVAVDTYHTYVAPGRD